MHLTHNRGQWRAFSERVNARRLESGMWCFTAVCSNPEHLNPLPHLFKNLKYMFWSIMLVAAIIHIFHWMMSATDKIILGLQAPSCNRTAYGSALHLSKVTSRFMLLVLAGYVTLDIQALHISQWLHWLCSLSSLMSKAYWQLIWGVSCTYVY